MLVDYIKKDSFHTFKTTADIFYLKEDINCESRDYVMWSFALDVKKNTLERLDKEK